MCRSRGKLCLDGPVFVSKYLHKIEQSNPFFSPFQLRKRMLRCPQRHQPREPPPPQECPTVVPTPPGECRWMQCLPPTEAFARGQGRWPPAALETSVVGVHPAKKCQKHPTCPSSGRRSTKDEGNPWAAKPAGVIQHDVVSGMPILRTFAMAANTAGSWRRTQTTLGAVKPGNTQLPVISENRESAFSDSASSWLRVSFHRMQGRNGRFCASSRVAPCIWPVDVTHTNVYILH
jgi:hypothetical protein